MAKCKHPIDLGTAVTHNGRSFVIRSIRSAYDHRAESIVLEFDCQDVESVSRKQESLRKTFDELVYLAADAQLRKPGLDEPAEDPDG